MSVLELLTALGLPQDFHFIRPLWLLGLPALLILGMMLLLKRGTTRWEDFIPQEILEALRVTGGKATSLWKWLLPLCLMAACVAAAGPTWKKIPVPTAKSQYALIILLDLSPSMLATDISPDRLTRVKYKLIDILRARTDGQTALIAYSGSPHRVAPLTDDTRTIESLLPALHPAMMPSQGSDVESAVELALEMLQSTGFPTGQILLITDGVAPAALRTINDLMGPEYRLSILGIGSTEAVPIPKPGGGFVSDSRGEIVLTELNRDELQILAGFHGGRYVELQTDDSDVRYLMQAWDARPGDQEQALDSFYDGWEDVGYYLVLLLIPFAAYAFRRGLVFCVPLFLVLFLSAPQPVQALSWQDLWKTPDQQAAEALESGDPALAAEKFRNSDWAAYAQYRNQDYESAAMLTMESETDPTALSYYNAGNALALNGELEKAIGAYDKALELEPGMDDAEYNKSIIEQLLDQQQQDNQQQDQNQDSQSDQSQNQDSQNQGSSEQENQNSENQNSDNENQGESQDQQQQAQQENSQESETSESEEQSNQEQQAGQEPETEQTEEQSEASQQAQPEEPSEHEEETNEELEAMMAAQETPEELDAASEQWLRAITDDPSGLLRRKFEYESQVYEREQRYLRTPSGNEQEERY